MDLIIKQVEEKCGTKSFKQSTGDFVKIRKQLHGWPSKIIQARIMFDTMCDMNLTTLSPLQLQRVNTLKQELIQILQDKK